EVLLASPVPQVRAWAVARLAQGDKAPPALGLLWRVLRDPAPSVRLGAARGLLTGANSPPPALVRRVAGTLGRGHTDDAVQAAPPLRQAGVAEALIRQTVEALERDRPVACPECGLTLTGGDRPGHLVQAHGYVDVFGSPLPRGEALARL